MKIMKVGMICLLSVFTAACAPQSKYAWGGYESSLYEHYKAPGDNGVFARNMSETIAKGESSGRRIPPGLYAEYGNILLEMGDSKQAAVYFQKEKTTWPESTKLMDTMIRLASNTKEAK
ncbi:MAG: DUF4810 domain-containing protein [Janthinobacterium lividum]